jgi:hypothetical protein
MNEYGHPSNGANIVAERRTILKWSSAAIVGALAFGGKLPGLDMATAFAKEGASSDKAVDLGEGDVGILNYAYALEQLEAAFYTQVTKTPYDKMQTADRDILTGIRDQEMAHRDFLKVALKKNAIPALQVDFSKIDFNDRNGVLTTALTFENLGVGAYNGAGHLLKKEEYLLIAGEIVSVEARHAAAIRYLLKSKEQANDSHDQANGSDASLPARVVNDKGLDQALAPSDVLAKAGPFVTTPITANDLASR